MNKETLLRLAQPAATFALALSVATLPLTVVAAGNSMRISGWSKHEYGVYPVRIECVKGCN